MTDGDGSGVSLRSSRPALPTLAPGTVSVTTRHMVRIGEVIGRLGHTSNPTAPTCTSSRREAKFCGSVEDHQRMVMHYQLVAADDAGTAYGDDTQFPIS
jgi:hypothetical protein